MLILAHAFEIWSVRLFRISLRNHISECRALRTIPESLSREWSKNWLLICTSPVKTQFNDYRFYWAVSDLGQMVPARAKDRRTTRSKGHLFSLICLLISGFHFFRKISGSYRITSYRQDGKSLFCWTTISRKTVSFKGGSSFRLNQQRRDDAGSLKPLPTIFLLGLPALAVTLGDEQSYGSGVASTCFQTHEEMFPNLKERGSKKST